MKKQKYLAICMGQNLEFLESVCRAYDNGETAGMRPIHRALVGIALRRKT